MRSWNRRSVELSLTPREAELLLQWLDDTCSDQTKDGVGFRLANSIRRSLNPEQ